MIVGRTIGHYALRVWRFYFEGSIPFNDRCNAVFVRNESNLMQGVWRLVFSFDCRMSTFFICMLYSFERLVCFPVASTFTGHWFVIYEADNTSTLLQ